MSQDNELENVVDENQELGDEVTEEVDYSLDEEDSEPTLEDDGFLDDEDKSDFPDEEAEEQELLSAEDENAEVSLDIDLSSEEDGSFDSADVIEGDIDLNENQEDDKVVFELEEALELRGQIEAIIFAAPKPVKVSDLLEILSREDDPLPSSQVEELLDELVEEYRVRAGGFKLEYVKRQGYQFRTVQAAAPLMEKIFSHRPRPLSKAALETLAIIAYRQPVTRADIEFVRGVDAGSIVKNLLERELVKCVGRKEVAGRPMLFGTSDEFLRVFGVGSIKELPPLSAFQPSPEMVQNALEAMDDEAVKAVDVEKLIGDGGEQPEISDGIVDINTSEHIDNEALFDENGDATIHVGSTESDHEKPETSDQELGEIGSDAKGPESEDGRDLSLDSEAQVMSLDENDQAREEIGNQPITELDQSSSIVLKGAELADMEGFDSDDGKDQNTEMDVPTGDSLQEGSGEVDL